MVSVIFVLQEYVSDIWFSHSDIVPDHNEMGYVI